MATRADQGLGIKTRGGARFRIRRKNARFEGQREVGLVGGAGKKGERGVIVRGFGGRGNEEAGEGGVSGLHVDAAAGAEREQWRRLIFCVASSAEVGERRRRRRLRGRGEGGREEEEDRGLTGD